MEVEVDFFSERECIGFFAFRLRIVMNTRSSWADLASNSADERWLGSWERERSGSFWK